ncbi:MAG: hypothetical protein ABR905_13660 [Terracidiphilus sp.]|jgi:hypothetical protein
MRRALLSGLAGCLLLSTVALAGGRNAADYPLRVHIYQFNGYSHYAYQTVNYVDGEGRANLYENGEPRGFDFKYRCGERLRGSAGYETYVARWKKAGKELEILLPQFGKPDSYDTCDLVVLMKENTVYHRSNGLLGEEPAAKFKAWMEKVQYDPEHGKNEPVPAPPVPVAPSTPEGAGANAPKQTGPQ